MAWERGELHHCSGVDLLLETIAQKKALTSLAFTSAEQHYDAPGFPPIIQLLTKFLSDTMFCGVTDLVPA